MLGLLWLQDLQDFCHYLPNFTPYELVLSITLIVLLSLMNIAGLKTSKFFTLAATVAKLIPIIAFAACAIFFIKGGIDKGNFTPFLQLEPGADIMKAISSTAIYIFYGFIGFELCLSLLVKCEIQKRMSLVPF